MNISTVYFQKLWWKFRRRVFQYSIYGIKNPKWLLMFTFSRFQLIRSISFFTAKPPSVEDYREGSSCFEDLDVDYAVEQLRRNGLYLDINLPVNILHEILEFANCTNYFGNKDPQLCFSLPEKETAEMEYGKTFFLGYHFNPASRCPAIEKLQNDPKLWEIATRYLVAEPVLAETLIWWSFVTEKVPFNERTKFAQGLFHYDLEDYRCLKFYFYLTDVDLSSGPHVCVKGSHKKKKLKHQFSLVRDRDDKEIIDYYGIKNVIPIYGKAGSGFAEDPFCFHKGVIPVHGNRLILGVKFTLNNYGLCY